jgi:hypothetical protein
VHPAQRSTGVGKLENGGWCLVYTPDWAPALAEGQKLKCVQKYGRL